MPFAHANNIRIYYEIHGHGEPLVLLEGLGSDHTGLLRLQVPAFLHSYQCVLIDNRGVGLTDKPDAPYSTQLMAEDVVGLLDELGIDQAHIAGWSMGGSIAMHMAIGHPARVRTLMLHCTLARTDRYLAWQLERRRVILQQLGREELYRHILLTAYTPRFFEERFDIVENELCAAIENENPQPTYAYLRQLDACIDHDAEASVAEIRVPTLITVGAEDRLVAPRFAYRLKELIPHAELVVIENAAHGHSEEQTEKFNEVCLDFLRRSKQRGP